MDGDLITQVNIAAGQTVEDPDYQVEFSFLSLLENDTTSPVDVACGFCMYHNVGENQRCSRILLWSANIYDGFDRSRIIRPAPTINSDWKKKKVLEMV